MGYTEEEKNFFQSSVVGLTWAMGCPDNRGGKVPYGVGETSIRMFREVIAIVSPRSILEIGTGQGYSAALFLRMTQANIKTIDISDRAETLHAIRVLQEKYPGRLKYVNVDSRNAELAVSGERYDMAFIDGDHCFQGVFSDLELCVKLKIRWVFLDDWLPVYGPGTQEAVKKSKVTIQYVRGNMALVKTLT